MMPRSFKRFIPFAPSGLSPFAPGGQTNGYGRADSAHWLLPIKVNPKICTPRAAQWSIWSKSSPSGKALRNPMTIAVSKLV